MSRSFQFIHRLYIYDQVCRLVGMGCSWKRACAEVGVGYSSLMRWRRQGIDLFFSLSPVSGPIDADDIPY